MDVAIALVGLFCLVIGAALASVLLLQAYTLHEIRAQREAKRVRVHCVDVMYARGEYGRKVRPLRRDGWTEGDTKQSNIAGFFVTHLTLAVTG